MKEKELDFEIVSTEEAYWREIKESTLKDIERLKKLLKFNEAILSMSEDKILQCRPKK